MTQPHTLLALIRLATLALVGTICVLVFGPFQGLETELFGLSDKEAHALAFFGLTAISLLALPRIRRIDVALLSLAFGALIEIVQTFVGRSGELNDWLADAFGVGLAILPMYFESLRLYTRAQTQTRPRRRRSDQLAALKREREKADRLTAHVHDL